MATQAEAAAFTAESLLADLAAARKSGSSLHCVQSAPERFTEAPRRSSSVFDRALVSGALAVGSFVLLMMSPLHDRIPAIERISQLLQ